MELRDGQIVTRVGFNKSDVLVVSSNGRYNTGKRTTIEATKSGGDGTVLPNLNFTHLRPAPGGGFFFVSIGHRESLFA